MKKIFLILAFLPLLLYAEPYYSEYVIEGYTIVFYGDISPKDEPRIMVLERKYMMVNEPQHFYSNKFSTYKSELEKLGIEIEIFKHDD